MKKVFLICLIIECMPSIYGQSINLDSIFEPKLSGELFYMKGGTVGKQFYDDNWINGDIKLKSGEWVFNKKLKYNTFMDEVIWLQVDSFRQIKLEKHFIDEFCFKNPHGDTIRFIRIPFKLDPLMASTDIFVQVLCEKKASLYVFRNVKPVGTITKYIDGVNCSFDRLLPRPVYILNLPDHKKVVFKKIRNSVLLRSLPEEYKTSVRELIHQNHLSIRKENELVHLVGMIN